MKAKTLIKRILNSCSFERLPRIFQISIVIDNYYINEDFDPECQISPDRMKWWDNTKRVDGIIRDYAEYLTSRPDIKKFRYGYVPMPLFQKAIMESAKMKEEYGSFEKWHLRYKGDRHKNVLPVIIDIKDPEYFLVDGWQRLHGYVTDKVEMVPVVMYN